MSAEQLQDWIAGITYVPKGYVPLSICDSEFAYHWYRYITRVAAQKRKRPDDQTAKLLFEMFADESSTEDRVSILRSAHRNDYLKLIPTCAKSELVIVQHTSREARAGVKGPDDIWSVCLTVYRRASALLNKDDTTVAADEGGSNA